jgi:predicted nicotinamide N-methyase
LPGYLLKHENVAVVGAADLVIRSLLDREQFSDPLGESAAVGIDPAAWPMFGQIWPSERVLANVMAARPVTKARILELGCGLALASLVSSRRGANITATDWHPLTGSFLRENLRLNAITCLPYVSAPWQRVNLSLGRFDLVIASDVLYERDDSGLLSRFIQRHTRASAEVMIVDPDRGNRPAFNRRMQDLGFALTDIRADYLQPDGNKYKGRILRFTREVAG